MKINLILGFKHQAETVDQFGRSDVVYERKSYRAKMWFVDQDAIYRIQKIL